MDKKVGQVTYTLVMIQLGLLVIDGNIRVEVDGDEIRRLGQSLNTRQIHPLIVLDNGDGTFLVIDGGKRVRAAQAAGMTELLAAVTTERLSESEIRELQLITIFHRSDPSDADKWRAMEAFKAEHPDWTNAKIAEYFNIDPKMVKILLSPGLVIPEARDAFFRDKIGSSDCHTLSLHEDAAEQGTLLQMRLDGASRDKMAEESRKLRNGNGHADGNGTVPAAAEGRKPKAARPKAEKTADAAEPQPTVTIALPGGRTVVVIGADAVGDALLLLRMAAVYAKKWEHLDREKFEGNCRKDVAAKDADAEARRAKAVEDVPVAALAAG